MFLPKPRRTDVNSSHNICACFALIWLFLSTSQANADGLQLEQWRGHTVLRLSGPIKEGAADEFARLIPTVPSLPHGMPVLLLDSPGGLVDEAFRISALMDLHPMHTVVPDGAHCASACASIVFVAGAYRTVEEGGLLGQHSCSLGGQADQACNDRISSHAVDHGVSYGSISAFITYVAPDKIVWFSRQDAEGWGITRYPGEAESGFQKSEPRVLKMLTGRMPLTQSAWRLDFRDDGFEAFSRTASDYEREAQINLFCVERLQGRLFLSMYVTAPVSKLSDAVLGLRVQTDSFQWDDGAPTIWQADLSVSEVITEIPRDRIKALLSKAGSLRFTIAFRSPYQPMFGQTSLLSSRKVLRFAANHCANSATTPLQ
ncbi:MULTISPECIES: hypothetical protein [unclassified Mesorhizobium]|uniref:hypothetical protein n=1 Tax=unclassified Mesorhizobium TaxID=325217 RepID=UPI001CCC8886|nr:MULTISPECIES: hypothetical protein [unclassified Mesorhizobium]MBZ9679638.1 hypothetical protein [Mesorhizobium sp. CO1-1-2]MBZ9925010.1 hypothetical protein [Mesorhizobium sp. BR1-1-4]